MLDPSSIGELDGTSREARRDQAQRHLDVKLDDLDLPALLVMAVDHAALITFSGGSGEGWDAFLQSHELIVMARILTLDLEAFQARFSHAWLRRDARWAAWDVESVDQGKHPPSPLVLAGHIESWHRHLERASSPAGEALFSYMTGLLEGLGPCLGPLRIAYGCDWDRLLTGALGLHGKAQERGSDDVPMTFHALLQCARMIRSRTSVLWTQALKAGTHDPSIGLLVAFATQLSKVRGRLDAFGRFRQEFLYRDVLGGSERPFRPDHAIVVVEALGDALVRIPASTRFLAGKDEQGKDLIFASQQDAWVGSARVETLLSMAFPQDTHGHVQACWCRVLDVQAKAPSSATGICADGSRPIGTYDGRIGLAIAHPILFLKEGTRRVRLRMKFSSSMDWESRLQEHSLEVGSGSDAQIRLQDGFLKLFHELFEISLSTKSGWTRVPECLPSRDDGDLVLAFTLGLGFPEVIGCDRLLHGQELDTSLPVVKLELARDASCYGLSVLTALELESIGIDVSVEGCRDLVVHNQISRLSTLSPFQLFGPIPEVGSYLVVGCAEAATKSLQSFCVNIQWAAWPEASSMESWYAGYPKPPSPRDFLLDVSVLCDGLWNGAATSLRQGLFRCAGQSGAALGLSSMTRLDCANVVGQSRPQGRVPAGEFDYTPSSRNGFFRFSLAGPSGAFGHELHPALLSTTLMHNARIKVESLQRPLPRQPITPKVASIHVDYASTATLSARGDKGMIFHLHPFGWEHLDRLRKIPFLPNLDFRASLHIGLRASRAPEVISLGFFLEVAVAPSGAQGRNVLSWSCLTSQGWKSLAEDALLQDGTQGLQTTGIVTLRLPLDMSLENPLMPAGHVWLRAEIHSDPSLVARILSVKAQALDLVWTPQEGQRRLSDRLPKASITGLQTPIVGISGVCQIQDSHMGSLPEDDIDWRIRTAERLRHHGRALSLKDCQQLVLEAFPEVGCVKAFPGCVSQAPDAREPGRILVVPVLRQEQDQLVRALSMPRLREIQAYLQARTASCVKVEVANPLVDEVTVRCSVLMQEEMLLQGREEQLQQGLKRFLHPWSPGGCGKHFGWFLRQRDIEAFLRSFSFVKEIRAFSLLRVSRDPQGCVTLLDTARRQTQAEVALRPSHPWSILQPAATQQIFMRVSDDHPVPLGLGELALGSTFVLSEKEVS